MIGPVNFIDSDRENIPCLITTGNYICNCLLIPTLFTIKFKNTFGLPSQYFRNLHNAFIQKFEIMLQLHSSMQSEARINSSKDKTHFHDQMIKQPTMH